MTPHDFESRLVRDPELLAQMSGYNQAWDVAPSVALRPHGDGDVAAAIDYASERGLGVAVQSTGHGRVDATTDAFLLDTSGLRSLEVDPDQRTARVDAGVRWTEVIESAARFGLAPPSGSYPGVGVMGYSLGGGLGPLGRKYGYAADHVREVTVVAADGQTYVASPTRNPELFWGIRGGKGNFGIVTSMVMDLLPVSELFGGGIYFAGDATADILHNYFPWAQSLPEEATSSIALIRMPDVPEVPEAIRGKFVVHLRMAHLGSADEGAALLAPMRRLGPTLLENMRTMPYTDVASIHNDPPEPTPFWDRSALLRDVTDEAIDRLVEVAGPSADLPLAMVEVRHLGGALARQPETPNAVGGRDAEFNMLMLGVSTESGFSTVKDAGAAVVGAVQDSWTGNSILNFLGPDQTPDQIARAFKADDYVRLQELKKHWDPDNLFRFGHVIPTADIRIG
ncbi:FAD-binding oxidoreductase [Diaminobutyricimonas sp. LJ205]|uniref:FAD-binding oxidoreductase n=1 Tax=Diaminobutyricimonas sp. LJ205 TaxID=2683590 RepID=UPI0012F4B838|nr:FAD-binding oxidoreductase [Diaminobutyricimonas sp. LJ205]